VIKVPTPFVSILTVPDPAPVATEVTALNVPGAIKVVGKDRVTAPVEAEAVIWLVVPVIEETPVEEVRQVAQARVNELPKDTAPPPVKGPVVFTVTDELVKSMLATDPSTMEAELTEAVVINPFTSTAKRLVLAALFWA